MSRQDAIRTIADLLPRQPTEKLEALLGWLEQEDDPFEAKLRDDVGSGKLDQIIAEVIAQDEAGETLDLETSCDQNLLGTLR